MLFLEAGYRQISWWLMEGSLTVSRGSETCQNARLPERIQELMAGAETIAYVLLNGGDTFPNPVIHLVPEMLAPLESVIPLFPPANRLTFLMVEAGLRSRPGIYQYILCETAYFRDMPLKASAFALPYSFFDKGLRRYGGDGLFHQWAWDKARQQSDRLQRLITIHLGDRPSMAAQLDGRPIETSLGFSPLDGIPSMDGCGEVDPSIVLLLAEEGMQPDEIEQTLARESGLTALLGKSAHWVEAVSRPSPQTLKARQVLLDQVVKGLGSGLAVLGGVDAIEFACEDVVPWLEFAGEICHKLEFAGVQPAAPYEDQEYWRLTGRDSRIQVFGLNYPRPLALTELVSGWTARFWLEGENDAQN
jgi:acetate kinase